MIITIRRLSSGYYHLRGAGPCNWAQVPNWPCAEATLREHAFPGAREEFFEACMAQAVLELLEETPS
jgi:hypothetical protein